MTEICESVASTSLMNESLKSALKKAKKCQIEEDRNSIRLQKYEGQLHKFTNMMKGYQPRWFILNPNGGQLEYFEREELKSSKPRGCINLTYASICPSDEDSLAFTINCINAETYRFRALNTKDRQEWVNRLRAVAEHYSDQAIMNVKMTPRNLPNAQLKTITNTPMQTAKSQCNDNDKTMSLDFQDNGSLEMTMDIQSSKPKETIGCNIVNALREANEFLRQLESDYASLSKHIDSIKISNPDSPDVYRTLLLSKASTKSAILNLSTCRDMVQNQSTIFRPESNSDFIKSGLNSAKRRVKKKVNNFTNRTI